MSGGDVAIGSIEHVLLTSQGVLSDFKMFGLNLFDFLDTVATNYMLPTVAILTCLYIGWFAPKDFFRKELDNNGSMAARYIPAVLFIIRYIAPLLISIILLTKIIG